MIKKLLEFNIKIEKSKKYSQDEGGRGCLAGPVVSAAVL